MGSSEAIMLAVLNMKWAWRKKRIAQGKPHDKPNLVRRQEEEREEGREERVKIDCLMHFPFPPSSLPFL